MSDTDPVFSTSGPVSPFMQDSRTEQSEFRGRCRFGVDTGERVSFATMESVLNEFWTFAPELAEEQRRGSFWIVEAYDGFGRAVRDDGPDGWTAGNGILIGPRWIVEATEGNDGAA